ncbi:hypothetical protein L2E82_42814 [Cichorium intybus]|uniref:Uncharacterized protein n=1 Tax=Cichorium intybus TaxID=13427 RepID=A0ACB8ZNK9_CICIN|nr:hypothetical protein L2E82_42814 [Cichorium intybus]
MWLSLLTPIFDDDQMDDEFEELAILLAPQECVDVILETCAADTRALGIKGVTDGQIKSKGTSNGTEFMRKQELIDAAEASGLPEIGKGKASQFGVSSGKDWYSGWNCMKKLIDKGLAVKSSNPAKYMLTELGKELARDCMLRSRLVDYTDGIDTVDLNQRNLKDTVCIRDELVDDVSSNLRSCFFTHRLSFTALSQLLVDLSDSPLPTTMSTGTFSSHPASSFIRSLADLYLQTTFDKENNKEAAIKVIDLEVSYSSISSLFSSKMMKLKGKKRRVLNQGEISIDSGQEEEILQLDMWGLTPSEFENLPYFQMNNNDAGFGTMNYRNRQMQFSQQEFPAM